MATTATSTLDRALPMSEPSGGRFPASHDEVRGLEAPISFERFEYLAINLERLWRDWQENVTEVPEMTDSERLALWEAVDSLRSYAEIATELADRVASYTRSFSDELRERDAG